MKKILGPIAFFVTLLFAAFPEVVGSAAREALSLCVRTLVPSLFPFFVCANMVIATGLTKKAAHLFAGPAKFLFRVSGEGASAILLGLISGYPAGAAVSCRLYENGSISKGEGERLLGYTNNAGPLFILGVVGVGMYQSREIGVLLLFSSMAASLCTGVCMRFYGGREKTRKTKAVQKKHTDPMGDAVHTILQLCGYVVFFAVLLEFAKKAGIVAFLCNLLKKCGLGENTAALLSMGIFELSSAVASGKGALPAMAALLSFGGLSVFLQTASIVRKAGLSMRPYVLGKILAAVFSASFCRVGMQIYPVTVETGLFLRKTVLYTEYLSAAVLMAMGVYLLYRWLGKTFHGDLQGKEECDTIKKVR